MSKKRNPNDSTLRNVRAAAKRLQRADANLEVLRRVMNKNTRKQEEWNRSTAQTVNRFIKAQREWNDGLIQFLMEQFGFRKSQVKKLRQR